MLLHSRSLLIGIFTSIAIGGLFAATGIHTFWVQSGEATTAQALPGSANLSINLLGPQEVTAGEEFDYTIAIMNHGPSIVRGVRITYPLPDTDLTYKDRTPGCSIYSRDLLCEFSNLQVGTPVNLTLTFKATPSFIESEQPKPCPRTVESQARISAIQGRDYDQSDNISPTLRTKIECIDLPNPESPRVRLSLAIEGPEKANRGTTALYRMTAENTGTADALHISITLTPPGGWVFDRTQSSNLCQQTSQEILCTNFNLAARRSSTLQLGFLLPANLPCDALASIRGQIYSPTLNQSNTAYPSNTVRTKITCDDSNLSTRSQSSSLSSDSPFSFEKCIANSCKQHSSLSPEFNACIRECFKKIQEQSSTPRSASSTASSSSSVTTSSQASSVILPEGIPFCFEANGQRTSDHSQCTDAESQRIFLFPGKSFEDAEGIDNIITQRYQSVNIAQETADLIHQTLERLVFMIEHNHPHAQEAYNIGNSLDALLAAYGPPSNWNTADIAKIRGQVYALMISAQALTGRSISGPSSTHATLRILQEIFQRFPAFLKIATDSGLIRGGEIGRAYEGYRTAREALLQAQLACEGEGSSCMIALQNCIAAFETLRWMEPAIQNHPQIRALFADLEQQYARPQTQPAPAFTEPERHTPESRSPETPFLQ